MKTVSRRKVLFAGLSLFGAGAMSKPSISQSVGPTAAVLKPVQILECGISHQYGNYKRLLHAVHVGDSVQLALGGPGYFWGKNAVSVCHNHYHLGHIATSIDKPLVRYLKEGRRIEAKISEIMPVHSEPIKISVVLWV